MKKNHKTNENIDKIGKMKINKENIQKYSSKKINSKKDLIHFSPIQEEKYALKDPIDGNKKCESINFNKIQEFFQISTSSKNVQQKEDVCLKLYKEIIEAKERMNQLSSKRIQDELKECTFAPSIHYAKRENSNKIDESWNNSNRIYWNQNVVF